MAGILSGAMTVILWDYIPLAGGFAVSLLVIVAVSLLTPAPEGEMLQEFDDVKNNRNIKT